MLTFCDVLHETPNKHINILTNSRVQCGLEIIFKTLFKNLLLLLLRTDHKN